VPLPRSVARFNHNVTNRITVRVAPFLPGFGVVLHTGRGSGTRYRTPVNVRHTAGELRFALTYGRSDWVRNVLDGGPSYVYTRQGRFPILAPTVIADAKHRGWPLAVRIVLRLTRTTEELRAGDGTAAV
jgi:deazaflavin-dependent oxidoreductase (nitroreductase family)